MSLTASQLIARLGRSQAHRCPPVSLYCCFSFCAIMEESQPIGTPTPQGRSAPSCRNASDDSSLPSHGSTLSLWYVRLLFKRPKMSVSPYGPLWSLSSYAAEEIYFQTISGRHHTGATCAIRPHFIWRKRRTRLVTGALKKLRSWPMPPLSGCLCTNCPSARQCRK